MCFFPAGGPRSGSGGPPPGPAAALLGTRDGAVSQGGRRPADAGGWRGRAMPAAGALHRIHQDHAGGGAAGGGGEDTEGDLRPGARALARARRGGRARVRVAQRAGEEL